MTQVAREVALIHVARRLVQAAVEARIIPEFAFERRTKMVFGCRHAAPQTEVPAPRVRRFVVRSTSPFPVAVALFQVARPVAVVDTVLVCVRPPAVAHVVQPFAVIQAPRSVRLLAPPAAQVVHVFALVVVSGSKHHVALAVPAPRAPPALVDAAVGVEHVARAVS